MNRSLATFLMFFFLCPILFAKIDLKEALGLFRDSTASKLNLIDSKKSSNELAQAKAALLPNLKLLANTSISDEVSEDKSSEISSKLQLSQSLFTGGREWYGLKYLKNLDRANLQLSHYYQMKLDIVFVSDYFELLNLKGQKDLVEEQLRVSTDRENLLRKRQKIGQSKKSDLLNARAQKMSAQIALRDLESNLKLAEENLSKQIGKPIKADELEFTPVNVSQWKIEISEQHPLALAVNLQGDAFDNLVKASKANHMPSLSLLANYYLKYNSSSTSSDKKWDAGVYLELPLYSGGIVRKEVEASLLKKEEARLSRKEELEQLNLALKDLNRQFNEQQKNMQSLILAVDLYKQSYEESKKEYDLGLISNVEVLTAFNEYIQEKKSLEQIKYQQYARTIQYKIYNGEYQ